MVGGRSGSSSTSSAVPASQPATVNEPGGGRPCRSDVNDMRGSSSPPTDEPVSFALFGGVRVVRDGVEVEITQPKQRAILALLLSTPGEPVSLSEIIDALWSGEPAASVTNQIHRHVGALRRAFQPELQRRQVGRYILPAGTGYRLVAERRGLRRPAFPQPGPGGTPARRDRPGEEALRTYLELARGRSRSGWRRQPVDAARLRGARGRTSAGDHRRGRALRVARRVRRGASDPASRCRHATASTRPCTPT